MKKLQEVLLKTFSEQEAMKTELSNIDYLQLFLDAKKIEGCSERTIHYYQTTIEKMFTYIETPIRKISTEEMFSANKASAFSGIFPGIKSSVCSFSIM